MEALSQRQVTQLVLDWSDRDNEALNRLIPLVYEELKRMAEQLNKAYEQRADWVINLKIEPLFDPLRSDPRFADIVRRMVSNRTQRRLRFARVRGNMSRVVGWR